MASPQSVSSISGLNQGVGYGLVVGLGLLFSGMMLLVIRVQARFTPLRLDNVDEFTSASKNVKAGLIACGIVSAWTWSATLLQSSAVAFQYGISGPYWYAAGATVQVLLFAQNAAKLKMHAPQANTFLQVIHARWGVMSHLILMGFSLVTNLIVSAMLITGASATINDLTGMSTIASCFLIPANVVVYVVIGGMRASLIGDYIHTTVLYIVIFIFMFSVYRTSGKIGSASKMYELLVEAARVSPVKGNAGGSYVTIRSLNGLVFGVINLVGNFATVYNDQAYWQRAIASRPETAVPGFLLGGLSWFSIPFSFATALGLGAVALNAQLTPDQVSAGLVAPTAANLLLGQFGAACILIILFLAVTSATSAELVAVSSVVTYDIFKTYMKPAATERQMIFVTHLAIGLYGVVMAILGVVFYKIGISMGWLYLFMGTILGGSVAPIAFCIMSKSANRTGCISGSVLGLISGLIAWLVTTSKLNDGIINIATTGQNYPMLAGNLASIGVSTIICLASSWFRPENFDFSTLNLSNQHTDQPDIHIQMNTEAEMLRRKEDLIGVDKRKGSHILPPTNGLDLAEEQASLNMSSLLRSYRVSVISSVGLFLVLVILIPFPLFFTSHIYSQAGFTAWVVMGFLWLFGGAIGVILVPVWESRLFLKELAQKMLFLQK